ncbi:MAG TPA: type II secretion system protein [Phycisphaerales bacterium]|nr:type II secretion system protein [Phycisphaerales bacterium]
MRSRRAFSLLELTIVLAIVAVTSAITLPKYFDSVRRTRVEGAARRMAADIERLRDRAREQGREQRFVLASGGYALISTDDAGNATKQAIDLTIDPYLVGVKAQVVTNRGITFDAMGRASDPIVVYVTNGEISRGVSFDPVSGRAEVFIPERMGDGRVHADGTSLPARVRGALPVGTRTNPTQPSDATAVAVELNDVLR